MGDHRRPKIPFDDAPRGVCRWCGEPILHEVGPKQGEVNRRRRWHQACVDDYNLSDPREARRLTRRRDRGVCGECRLNTNQLKREVKGRGRAARLRALGFKPRQSLWELDHIVPLIDGGGHGLDNLQTLCVPCHERKTSREARERTARRKEGAADASPIAESAQIQVARRPESRDLESVLAKADSTNERVDALLSQLASAR